MLNLINRIKNLDSRGKNIFYSAISGLIAKTFSLFVIVVSLPLTYKYLDNERFGVLSVLTSAIALLNFADLGLGLGLANRLPDYFMAIDKEGKAYNVAKRAISSVFFVLILLGIVLGICFFLLERYINWGSVFNVDTEEAVHEARLSMYVLVCFFAISLPFTVVQKYLFARQKNFLNDVWLCASNVVSICLIILFVRLELGVPFLIGATYGITSLAVILNYIVTFTKRSNQLFKPEFSCFDVGLSKLLIKDGGVYFFLQLFAVLMNGVDAVFVAQLLTPAHVAIYTVGFRLFQILMYPTQVFISPLLPAFNDAFSKGEVHWIRRTFWKYTKNIAGSSLLCVLLYMLGANTAIRLWIDDTVTLPLDILISFAILIVYYNFNALLSYAVLNPRFLRFVFLTYLITTIATLILKVYLGKKFGISGVVLSSVAVGTVCYFIPILKKLKKLKVI